MAAIYSNGGNRWNILAFNFTKRDALSSVYKISMLRIREQYFCCDGYTIVDNSIAVAQGGYTCNISPAIYVFITLFIGWSRNVSFINFRPCRYYNARVWKTGKLQRITPPFVSWTRKRASRDSYSASWECAIGHPSNQGGFGNSLRRSNAEESPAGFACQCAWMLAV